MARKTVLSSATGAIAGAVAADLASPTLPEAATLPDSSPAGNGRNRRRTEAACDEWASLMSLVPPSSRSGGSLQC
jgi:hypothetical protein